MQPAAIHFPTWLRPEIIPGLPLRWYGLMYILAFSTAYLLFMVQVRARRLEVERDDIVNFFFWTIVGLLLGARIFAALVYDTSGRYWRNPLLVFWPFDENFRFTGLAGMSYHGGLIGAVLGATLYARRRRIDILDWGDMLVAGIPLGYTFGRLGNFINGELYGRVTTVAWGMIFPLAERFSPREPWVRRMAAEAGMELPAGGELINLPRHPSQLYQAFFEGIFLWAVLWFLLKNRRPFKGFLIGCYLIGYGLVRFFIEYAREPDRDIGFVLRLGGGDSPIHLFTSFLDITTGQILCLLMIAAGLICLFVFSRRVTPAAPLKADRSGRKLRKKIK